MPNTANYLFPTPADTDLVKNGADAIRDLGDAVDTAMNTALGTKKSGLVLLNTTSFSAVASQSINDVFSATYDNYLLVVNAEGTDSNAQLLRLRLRVSGSDNSSNNYYWSGFNIPAGSATPTLSTFGSNGLTSSFDAAVSNSSTTGQTVTIINLFNPFATKRTSFESRMPYTDTSIPQGFHRNFQGQMSVTTSYTGFSLISAVGNVTGNVSVYGYNK